MMKKINYLSVLLVFATLVFNSSCNASKKEVSAPISEVVVKDKVITKTEVDSSKVVETQSETDDVILQKDTLVVNDEIINTQFNEAFDHSVWNELLSKHVSNNGNVNYKGFKKDLSILKSYLTALSEKIPNDSWSKEDKLGYWINAYNAFTVKLIVDRYPIKSIKDIESPWDFRFIKLGDTWFTLNDIEHKILRKMNEPRIHFAIVCASVSCPKLQNKAFKAETLDSQLDKATKEFLADPTKNNISENSLQLSRIFKWFSKDFQKKGNLIYFLNKYTEITISQKAKKSFKEYNWNLNE